MLQISLFQASLKILMANKSLSQMYSPIPYVTYLLNPLILF